MSYNEVKSSSSTSPELKYLFWDNDTLSAFFASPKPMLEILQDKNLDGVIFFLPHAVCHEFYSAARGVGQIEFKRQFLANTGDYFNIVPTLKGVEETGIFLKRYYQSFCKGKAPSYTDIHLQALSISIGSSSGVITRNLQDFLPSVFKIRTIFEYHSKNQRHLYYVLSPDLKEFKELVVIYEEARSHMETTIEVSEKQ